MELQFRRATAADVDAIVAMLADDVLGSSRERASPTDAECYRAARQWRPGLHRMQG